MQTLWATLGVARLKAKTIAQTIAFNNIFPAMTVLPFAPRKVEAAINLEMPLF